MRKAKETPQNSKVISMPGAGYDSLEFAINQFLLWEMRSRDCIEVKRCYIDIAADLESGVLLSQIVYWHLPDKEGKQKLTVYRDDCWWLAKAREDWWTECRLTPKQFDRAIRHLEEQQLVCTQVYKWQGQNTKHVRLDWAGLLQALSLLNTSKDSVVGFRRRAAVPGSGRPPLKKTKQDISELPNRKSKDADLGNSQITKQVSSELPNRELHLYAETTSETTTKTTLPPTPLAEGQREACCCCANVDPKPEATATSLATLSNQREPASGVQADLDESKCSAASLNNNKTTNEEEQEQTHSGGCQCPVAATQAFSNTSQSNVRSTTVAQVAAGHVLWIGENPTFNDIAAVESRLAVEGQLPMWRIAPGPNGFHPEFVEFVRQRQSAKYGEDKTNSDALGWIVNRESTNKPNHSQLLAEVKDWQESVFSADTPTEGQLLESELAIALHEPLMQIEDRFAKTAGKYCWEIAPGEPVPKILEWYANQIANSKRPELTGKPPMVLARSDLRDRFIAAAVYEEFRKYARQVIVNKDRVVQAQAPMPQEPQTVDIVAELSDETKLQEKIAKLQAFISSGVPFLINLGKNGVAQDPALEIVDSKVQEVTF